MDNILGVLLVVFLCAWAVWFSIQQIRERLDSGTAVDRTLSEVDNPRLLFFQVLGFILLIIAAVGTLGCVVGMFIHARFFH